MKKFDNRLTGKEVLYTGKPVGINIIQVDL